MAKGAKLKKVSKKVDELENKATVLDLENTRDDIAAKVNQLEQRVKNLSQNHLNESNLDEMPELEPADADDVSDLDTSTVRAGMRPALQNTGRIYNSSLLPSELQLEHYINIKDQLIQRENLYQNMIETLSAKAYKAPSTAHKEPDSLHRMIKDVNFMIWQLESFILTNNNPPLGKGWFEKGINSFRSYHGKEKIKIGGVEKPINEALEIQARKFLGENKSHDPNAPAEKTLYALRNFLEYSLERTLEPNENNLHNFSDSSMIAPIKPKQLGMQQHEIESDYADLLEERDATTSTISAAASQGRFSNLADNQVQINKDTVMKGAKRNTPFIVTHTIIKKDNQITLRIRLKKADFVDITDAEVYKLAIKLVENMRTMTDETILLKSKAFPPKLVKAISTYCAHMGYACEDQTGLDYKPIQGDLDNFRNMLKSMNESVGLTPTAENPYKGETLKEWLKNSKTEHRTAIYKGITEPELKKMEKQVRQLTSEVPKLFPRL